MEQPDGHVATAPDGTRIAYIDEGDGETLLLIPGLGYGAWSWSEQVEFFRSRARVLAVDNRGSGKSDAPEGPYTIEQMAEDAFAVISEVPGQVHVLGSSMGGYIALTLALLHPEKVKSLVLIATTTGGPGCTPVPAQTLRAWANATVFGPAEYARATMPFSFAPGWVSQHPDEFESLLAQRLRHPTSTRAWKAQFQACADFLEAGLAPGDITVPTLVMHGTADRVVPYRNMDHVAQRLPHAHLETLEGVGHLCWIEEPDRVNDLIARHLKSS